MRLNARAFALAAAILSGVVSFLLTLLSVLTGFAKDFFDVIAPFHPRYSPYKHSFIGALVSGIWMFIEEVRAILSESYEKANQFS